MLDVARVAHLETNRLPADVEPGLEATRFYDPIRGTFAAGAQAAVVEVDPVTGTIEILRYACVEDTGRVINPLIVEGQVLGAIAQGIGGALTEHLVYDAAGQLLTGTLMEYALPTAASMPAVDLDHIEVPADNLAGVRGVGEGGTLGPAAVLANAVADALAPLGVEVNELPLTPARLWTACAAAPPPSAASLTRGTAVEYPRASRDPMRRPPSGAGARRSCRDRARRDRRRGDLAAAPADRRLRAGARRRESPAPRPRGVRGVRRRGHRARRLRRRSRPVVLPHARPGPGPARDPACRRWRRAWCRGARARGVLYALFGLGALFPLGYLAYAIAALEWGRDAGIEAVERYVLTPLGSAAILGLVALGDSAGGGARREACRVTGPGGDTWRLPPMASLLAAVLLIACAEVGRRLDGAVQARADARGRAPSSSRGRPPTAWSACATSTSRSSTRRW